MYNKLITAKVATMKITPSTRNKTITLTEDELKMYSEHSISINKNVSFSDIKNVTACADVFDAAKYLPNEFADLIIADPPYNLTKTFGNTTFHKTTLEEYESFTSLWIESIIHTLKPTASIYVCCDWTISSVISSVLSKHFVIRNRITWQREKGRGSAKNWKNSSEDIWFATLSDKYDFHPERVMLRRRVLAPYKENNKPKDWQKTDHGNFRDTYPSNIWDDISVPFWSMPENTQHPTQKPEKLIAKLILASSNEGDTVFDPFMGSGTVPTVAKKLSRNYFGIEKEQMYCALAEKRISQVSHSSRIQGYEDNVFWERNSNINRKDKL